MVVVGFALALPKRHRDAEFFLKVFNYFDWSVWAKGFFRESLMKKLILLSFSEKRGLLIYKKICPRK
jgi:hypothetical protein